MKYHVLKWGRTPILDVTGGVIPDIVYLSPFLDSLDWGPLNSDYGIQCAMRTAYFGSEFAPDYVSDRMPTDDEATVTLIWMEPLLPSILSALSFSISYLAAGGSGGNLIWLYSQQGAYSDTLEWIADVERAVEFRSVLDLKKHLYELHGLALSPGLINVSVDAERFGDLHREASIVRLMEEFIPDDRGLDLVDKLLFENLTGNWDSWTNISTQLGIRTFELKGRGHSMNNYRFWHRILQLNQCGYNNQRYGWTANESVLEFRRSPFSELGEMSPVQVRLTSYGLDIKNEASVLPSMAGQGRWVGSRFFS